MSPPGRYPVAHGATRRRLALALLAILILGLLVAPAAALAAEVTFGKPEVTSNYGESIEFSVPITSAAPLARAELWLRFPGALGPYVIDVPVGAAGGAATLRYRLLLTNGGGISPNTPITVTWAAYPTAGAKPVLSDEQVTRYLDTSQEWRTIDGNLARVHWYEGSRAFAERALRVGEQAIEDTSRLLGVTGGDPIDIFIYGDEASFRAAIGPGSREWAGATPRANINTLYALVTPDEIDSSWLEIAVPHELVHIVFAAAVENPFRDPPFWLNEGIATYLTEGYTPSDRALVERAARANELMPLIALSGSFPTDAERSSLAYAETASAIDYLVRVKGDRALVDLVSSYADGLTDDEAFGRAVGTDLAGFQADWLAELGARAPERYGPQPAPPGPLPPGWSGPPATPAAGPTGNAAITPAPHASGPEGVLATPAGSPAASEPGEDTAADAAIALAPLLVVVVLVIVVVMGLVLVRRRQPGA